MKRTPQILLGILLLAGCAGPARRETLAQGDFKALEKQVGDLVRRKLDEARVEAASVVVVDGQSTVLESGYGLADKEAKKPADADTLYCIGSVTKLFTASALMRLQEQGEVDIDKPLNAYLPEFSIRTRFPDAPPITRRSSRAPAAAWEKPSA